MTKDRYLEMCEQMGQEPKLEEMPPAWEDFPDIARDAINTFASLGDRIYPEVGYVGKDYTKLPYYLNLYSIKDTELFLEILRLLESRAIQNSQDILKKERDKLKRKK